MVLFRGWMPACKGAACKSGAVLWCVKASDGAGKWCPQVHRWFATTEDTVVTQRGTEETVVVQERTPWLLWCFVADTPQMICFPVRGVMPMPASGKAAHHATGAVLQSSVGMMWLATS